LSDPYTDQEQVEKLKQWWKTYGGALLVGIALGLAILFGNKYWTDYKQQRAAAASALYDQLLEGYRKKAFDDVRKSAGKIIDEYAATPYAGLAAMMLARVNLDAKQSEEARRQLRWAVDNASDAGTRQAARLRLARVLAADGDIDGALALIAVENIAGFESDYEELRGDLLAAKGDKQAAREAYVRAIKHLDATSSYLPVLNMKLDDLGPETGT
jgi:predicted negative regulator of RcsB-dependent stress response